MFDPQALLDQQYTEANDTKVIPVPAGEYVAGAESAELKQWQAKDDPSKAGLKLVVVWVISDPAVAAATGREQNQVRQEIMLDLTEAGFVDFGKGKNARLGRLREALSLNTPGQPFAFSMIPGRMAKIAIGHRVVGEDVYTDVKGVAKL